ncbi:MAG: YgiQ family radical SAM protein [Thermodesulfobacteriota bacterium]
MTHRQRPAGRGFLPASADEMAERGWEAVDVVLVTGDAYIDHPSFGMALIGRWLEGHGYRVAVLAQPRHDRPDDFRCFGRPRLFFGITAGNLDSIVANYTGNARVRDRDDYSPGGNPYFGEAAEKKTRRRPDRATIVYANLARAAWPGVPVVLGGLEASLRRFAHYDYQQQKLRASVLTDAKADLLVYGMGERAVLEIARRLSAGKGLAGIPGTCERLTERELAGRTWSEPALVLPSRHEVVNDSGRFLDAELAIDAHARAGGCQVLLQQQQAHWVAQHPPAAVLSAAELDRLYSLPFTRRPHPAAGDVPAFRMIRDSVTIVRGCCGNCSFCAIARHQGPVVASRSKASILDEVRQLAADPDFRGTVSDLGGPTANLYGTSCASPVPCKRRDCLYPKVCNHFVIDEALFLDLLAEAAAIPKVRHLFVSSGLRMELLLRTPKLLAAIVARHTPGALKIAPEHTDPEVLRLMHKPGPEVLEQFLAQIRGLAGKGGKQVAVNPYLIASHPGCTVRHMEQLARDLTRLDLPVRQFQDFTPTPGTIATAMYVSGRHRETKRPIHVARKAGERMAQRAALEGAMVPGPRASGRRPR